MEHFMADLSDVRTKTIDSTITDKNYKTFQTQFQFAQLSTSVLSNKVKGFSLLSYNGKYLKRLKSYQMKFSKPTMILQIQTIKK